MAEPLPRRPVVALLAAPETSASVLYGLYDILLSVGSAYADMTLGEPGESRLDVRIVAASAEPFRCFGNILVEPHGALDQLGPVDVAIVCDMYTPIDTPPVGRYPAEVAWLRRSHADGALVASVCTGSLLLAEAGLLDGRTCATHWAYGELFRRHYPEVVLTEDAILNLDSAPDGIVTAGGVTSWQDLALHVIARYCGPEQAIHTAKVYLLAGHEDGQRPFAAMNRQVQRADAAIARSQAWIAEHFASPNPVAAMAAQAGLTPRTFGRRFRLATGALPIDYVHAIRIDEAKQRLERGSTATEDIGAEVGYQDPTFFRRLFRRRTGLTPAAYRRKYAAIGGAAGPAVAVA